MKEDELGQTMRRLSDAGDRVLWQVGFYVSKKFLDAFPSLAIKMQERGGLTNNLSLDGTRRKPYEANGKEHAE